MSDESIKTEVVIRIVDDDEAVRRALTRLVESMGMRAESFASPAELLDDLPGVDVGCLLLDVQLPGMDGFELYRRVVSAGQDTPVIFITAHPDASARTRAAGAEAVAFLEKPFDDEVLFEAIRAALERRPVDHDNSASTA